MDTADEKALLEKVRKSKVQVIHEEWTLGHTQPYAAATGSYRMSEPVSLRNVRRIVEDTRREMDEEDDHTGSHDICTD